MFKQIKNIQEGTQNEIETHLILIRKQLTNLLSDRKYNYKFKPI